MSEYKENRKESKQQAKTNQFFKRMKTVIISSSLIYLTKKLFTKKTKKRS
jgi:hypothetical protein